MADNEMQENAAPASWHAMRALGWVSVGLGIAAVGLLVGTELRKRYQFNRRTPYDFYANSDATGASEFGVGV